MIEQAEIHAQIANVRRVIEKRSALNPGEVRYKVLLKELDRVDREVMTHWPLDPEFSKSTRFGLFAVRELEDEPDLVDLLVSLDKALKRA